MDWTNLLLIGLAVMEGRVPGWRWSRAGVIEDFRPAPSGTASPHRRNRSLSRAGATYDAETRTVRRLQQQRINPS
jgi:hypothetical protein